MPDRQHWKLGLFVVVALALGVVGLIWLGAGWIGRPSVEAVTYFDESVQGLDIGSSVKFRGVAIGTVTGIGIAPDRRHVEVRADIFTDELERLGLNEETMGVRHSLLDPALRSPEVRVQLASSGITGVKFLQLDFFDPMSSPPPELPFEVPTNYFPSKPSTLKSLEAALAEVTTELPEMLMRAGRALEVTGDTLDSVRMTLEPLVSPDGPVVGALQEFRATALALRRGIEAADLGGTAAAAREATAAITRAADSVGGAAGSIDQAAVSVGGLSVDASGLADELQLSLEQLSRSLEAFRSLVDYLERDPAALVRGRGETAGSRLDEEGER